MKDAFAAAFVERLSQTRDGDALIAVIKAFRQRGLTQDDCADVLLGLRTGVDADTEDRLLEILDLVVGWCFPSRALWPAPAKAPLPWERLASGTGRATPVPALLHELETAGCAAAAEALGDQMLSQDAVMPCAPFVLDAIAERLDAGRVVDRDAVGRTIRRVLAAAAYQASAADLRRSSNPVVPALSGILAEERLLPRFVDADADEAVFEAWAPTWDDLYAWAILTIEYGGRLSCDGPPAPQ